MDEFEYKLFMDLQEALLAYSTPSLIKESYNRIRKIVDLYVEHIVAMAREIDSETRKKLIPLLFLPIDNWIIKNDLIFDDISIDRWNLTRNSSFGKIKTKALYDDMQQYLVKKAHEISTMLGKEFYVIYFDVFWNNRINNPGGNLFGVQTNYDFGNIKVDVKETINVHKRHFKPSNFSSFTVDNDDMNDNASYPPLVSIFVDEFMKFGIYLEKDFRCIKRNDGGYIFEAVYPRGKRKNIITIWPNKRGGGDIRIVGIGKYKDRRQFDYSDIGTSVLKEDLLEAYRRTQQ